jgi:hypothetical protein
MRGVESNEGCVVCGTRCRMRQDIQSQLWDCPRCGKFFLSTEAANVLSERLAAGAINRSTLSHRLRLAFNNTGKEVILTVSDLEQAYEGSGPPPNPDEQLEKLILWIGNAQAHPTDWAKVSDKQIAATIVDRPRQRPRAIRVSAPIVR